MITDWLFKKWSPLTFFIQIYFLCAAFCPEDTIEALPLGKEFQELCMTFIDLKEEEPKRRFRNLRVLIRQMKLVAVLSVPNLTANSRINVELWNNWLVGFWTHHLQVIKTPR